MRAFRLAYLKRAVAQLSGQFSCARRRERDATFCVNYDDADTVVDCFVIIFGSLQHVLSVVVGDGGWLQVMGTWSCAHVHTHTHMCVCVYERVHTRVYTHTHNHVT